MGAWTSHPTVTVRGPFSEKTAIVMKRDTNGWVRVFKILSQTDHRPVAQYNSLDGARMIIIDKETEYCWIGNASAKYID